MQRYRNAIWRTPTFVLGLRLFLGLLVDLLSQLLADIAEVGHRHPSLFQPSLCLLQLVIRELQLADKVADATSETTASE